MVWLFIIYVFGLIMSFFYVDFDEPGAIIWWLLYPILIPLYFLFYIITKND